MLSLRVECFLAGDLRACGRLFVAIEIVPFALGVNKHKQHFAGLFEIDIADPQRAALSGPPPGGRKTQFSQATCSRNQRRGTWTKNNLHLQIQQVVGIEAQVIPRPAKYGSFPKLK